MLAPGNVSGKWTPHGKRLIALSMCEKGKAFINAALLLRRHGGYEYPVLHLLCQGIEVLGKGYLLSVNYDKYKPELRKYGHNLITLITAIESESGVTIIKPKNQHEIETLNGLYSQHLLRYASGYDILVDPTSIKSSKILRRTAALMRMANRSGIMSATAI